jgi:hypothetical protein
MVLQVGIGQSWSGNYHIHSGHHNARQPIFFWHKRENHRQIRGKLISMGQEDLIGKLIDDQRKQHKREYEKNAAR